MPFHVQKTYVRTEGIDDGMVVTQRQLIRIKVDCFTFTYLRGIFQVACTFLPVLNEQVLLNI